MPVRARAGGGRLPRHKLPADGGQSAGAV